MGKELRQVLTARQMFALEFGTGNGSKNFMTPEVVWCVKASPSVRRGKAEPGSSRMFHSQGKATRHFERIQSILNGGKKA